MLARQIRSMRRGVRRMFEMDPVPEEAWIRMDQAKYLNVPFYHGSRDEKNLEIIDKIKEANKGRTFAEQMRIRNLKATGKCRPLVGVKVLDLFEALKEAKGVDESENNIKILEDW